MIKSYLLKIAYALALFCILGNTMSSAQAANDAAFNSQNVPSVMVAGQKYSVHVLMQNTGTTVWSTGSPIKLGSSNPQDNMTWGVGRILLANSVSPGSVYGFNFEVTAPPAPGTYNFQWRMLEEGIQWFGSPSQNLAITVTAPTGKNDARFVSQNIPTSMISGQVYPVSVTMVNSGNTTWTPAGGFRLGTQNPANNRNWGPFDRVELTKNVAPGESYTFSFNVTGPVATAEHPLNYYFQWMMVEEYKEWFGGPTSNTLVRVSGPVAPPELSLDCTSTTPTVSPTPASARCVLYNGGHSATQTISYSSITGTSISGPTGVCAAYTTCGVVTVTTALTPGTYSGTLTARPNTGSEASASINLTVTGQTANNNHPDVAWNSLIDAFNRGDKVKALSYFAAPEKYDSIFSSMGDRLRDIPATLSQIQFIEIGSNYATGVTNQTDSAGAVSQHYVSFIYKDDNWLIVDF